MPRIATTWSYDLGKHNVLISSYDKKPIKYTVRAPITIHVPWPFTIRKRAKVLPPEPEPEKVILHVAKKAAQIWKPKYDGLSFEFKRLPKLCSMTVDEFIETMPNNIRKGWAVTEIFEHGNGTWAKGTTVAYGSNAASSSLADMGWTSVRGTRQGGPPVWLVVHRIAQ